MVAIINNSVSASANSSNNSMVKNKGIKIVDYETTPPRSASAVNLFGLSEEEEEALESVDVAIDEDDDALALSAEEKIKLADEGAASPHSRFYLTLATSNNKTAFTKEKRELQLQALNSIIVLNSPSCSKTQSILDTYNGHLVNVGAHLLNSLRTAAPNQLAARVGDYNENLFYEMQDIDSNIGSIIETTAASNDTLIQQDIDEFETSIRNALQQQNIKYRGSFMSTESTMYQPAHVDYDYPILSQYGDRLYLAFFPLTEEGAFLQLWKDPNTDNTNMRDDDGNENDAIAAGRTGVVEGTVVYIPYGKMFIVPSDTIHGGGFKRGTGGNLRFHLYIDVEEKENKNKGAVVETANHVEEKKDEEDGSIRLLDHPMNKYTEKNDRRRELCERFVNANGLDSLLGVFFDT